MCWIDCYLGPPDQILFDAGKNFDSKEFRGSALALGTGTKTAPVEAHWTVGLIEKAHASLRRAFQILCQELKENLPGKHSVLQMAVKACNDSTGLDGLVPTLLVYGAYPRLSPEDAPTATTQERAAAVKKATEAVTAARARDIVNRALSTRNGPNTSSLHEMQPGRNVLVWREKGDSARQKGAWTGPFKLLSISGETCTVQLASGRTEFRSTVVKPFRSQQELAEKSKDADIVIDMREEAPLQNNEPRRSERAKARNSTIAAKTPGQWHEVQFHSVTSSEKDEDMMYLLEPNYADSRQKEIDGLLESQVFRLIPRSQLPEGARLFNSRFVDEVKHPGTEDAYEKSRLVIQAYNDAGKLAVLTQSPTIQRASQRLLLAIAVSFPWLRIYMRDISQAYTQAQTLLARKFYAAPPKDIDIGDWILEVLKPLYGIPESGNHWFMTYHNFFEKDCGMQISTFDPCLLYAGTPNDESFGVLGLQVDDTLFVAGTKFAAVEEEQLKKAGFLAKPREELSADKPMKFNGGFITKHKDGSILLNQQNQCENLSLITDKSKDLTSARGEVRSLVSPRDQYVAQRARGAYVATVCQPEASFDYSFAAQNFEPGEEGEKKAVKLLNKRIAWQRANVARGLTFVRLKGELKLIAFTDASFANNGDCSSQIGFVIVLADQYGNANILHYSSTKCKRVTRSVLASELYGMAHGFDHACVIKTTLEKMLQIKIPLIIATDSNSLYECLVKLGTTVEKRLMVDIMCLRQAYERRLIAEIMWIEGGSNPADAMTKSNACDALRKLIDTNKLELKTGKWVERPAEVATAPLGSNA